jgi:hypothetical protein
MSTLMRCVVCLVLSVVAAGVIGLVVYLRVSRSLPNGYELRYTRNGAEVTPVIVRPGTDLGVFASEVSVYRVFDEHVVGRTTDGRFFIIDTIAQDERVFRNRNSFIRDLNALGVHLNRVDLKGILNSDVQDARHRW